jgi:hypothetical protein
MKSIPERQLFKEQLVEVLDETVEPISDGVVEGEIESGWTGNFGSFTVLIDTEGKIDIAVSDYRESDSVLREDITIEQTLREARDFKSNRSL